MPTKNEDGRRVVMMAGMFVMVLFVIVLAITFFSTKQGNRTQSVNAAPVTIKSTSDLDKASANLDTFQLDDNDTSKLQDTVNILN